MAAVTVPVELVAAVEFLYDFIKILVTLPGIVVTNKFVSTFVPPAELKPTTFNPSPRSIVVQFVALFVGLKSLKSVKSKAIGVVPSNA